MELFNRILCEIMIREVIPTLPVDGAALVEMKCHQAVRQIHEILSDDTLEDPECFQRIEKIVCVLEDLGIDGGGRHDF